MKLPGVVRFRKCSLTDNELAEAVAEGLCKMYSEPVSVPSRHIPARPDEDFDLLVGELVLRFMEKIDFLKQVDGLCAEGALLIEKLEKQLELTKEKKRNDN